MKENKNIDRLFQEQFKNLDVNPNEEVWENIELRLREKKKKRVVPFWWKLSGVAAVLVVGLGIYNFAVDNDKVSNEIVIDTNVDKNSTSDPKDLNRIDNTKVVTTEDEAIKDNDASSKINEVKTSVIVSKSSQNNTAVANNSVENKSVKNNGALVGNSKTKIAVTNNLEENKNVGNNSKINNGIANSLDKNSRSNSDVANNSKTINGVVSKSDKIKNVITNSEENNNFKSNTAIVNSLEVEKSEIGNSNKNIDTNKPINNTQIIANKTNSELKIDEIKKIDSTSIVSVVPNAMEELLKEKEKKTSKEPKLNRWQLSSNVAPIYFSSATNGSPLDSELKNNRKTYKTNLSYGLGVNYALNKKIKLRTGVNTVSLNYDTNDVLIYQNVNAKTLDHVKPNSTGSFLQIESKNSSNVTANQEIASTGNVLKKFNSVVNQQIGYLEIPLEMSYKVLDKKFGVDIIGGFSTLLLNQNEVSVIASGVEMNIGEANNLNDIHFSTNVGLGFKYNFMKNFEARVEPVFKYQINTFVSDSGDFKPYFFGLYSGITFTF